MRNIVCIGGSSGALEAIQRLVRRLPADLPAAVFVVRHVAPESSGLLTQILQPHCALPVAEPVDGESFVQGRVYIAPPNRHLLLDRKTIKVADGPKENWVRPAIDPLFRTAGQFHGPRAIGIVLSGKLDDGAAGLWALKRRGGFAVVQDLHDAAAPEMPRHALAATEVDVVADAEEIGAMLPEWCRRPSGYAVGDLVRNTPEEPDAETTLLLQREGGREALDQIGVSSGLVCPECSGQLWQLKEGPLRYRCHVGHGVSAHTFIAQQAEVVESLSWQLLRAIEEENHLAAKVLEQNLSSEARVALASHLARKREKLNRLQSLLLSDHDLGAIEPALSRGDKGVGGGDGTDASPISRT